MVIMSLLTRINKKVTVHLHAVRSNLQSPPKHFMILTLVTI